jgi:hypothetical protein
LFDKRKTRKIERREGGREGERVLFDKIQMSVFFTLYHYYE